MPRSKRKLSISKESSSHCCDYIIDEDAEETSSTTTKPTQQKLPRRDVHTEDKKSVKQHRTINHNIIAQNNKDESIERYILAFLNSQQHHQQKSQRTQHRSDLSQSQVFDSVFDLSLLFKDINDDTTTYTATTSTANTMEQQPENELTHHSDHTKLTSEIKLIPPLLQYLSSSGIATSTNTHHSPPTSQHPRTKTSVVTQLHIAELLLPWSVQHILRIEHKNASTNKNKEKITTTTTATSTTPSENHLFILWKTLALCLESLFMQSASNIVTINSNNSNDYYYSNCKETDSILLEFVQGGWNYDKHKRTILNESNTNNPKQQEKVTHATTNKKKKTSSSSDTIASLLKQGTLNKLLVLAAQLACIPTHTGTALKDDVSLIQTTMMMEQKYYAARCYVLLLSSEYFRPTMDYVCSTLIPFLSELVSNVNTAGNTSCGNDDLNSFGIQLNFVEFTIIYVTLQILYKFQQQNRIATPKKVFTLLVSPTTFKSLAILYGIKDWYLTISKEDVNNEKDILESSKSLSISNLIEKILNYGLFHPIHHLDGFKAMNMNVPLIPSNANATVIDEDANQATQNTKEKNNSTIKSNYSTYQHQLFQTLESIMTMNFDVTSSDGIMPALLLRFFPLIVRLFVENHSSERNLSRNKESNTQNSTSVDKQAQIQFRFWSIIVDSIIRQLRHIANTNMSIFFQRSGNKTCAINLLYCYFHTLQECIHIVAKYDIYLPSYYDPKNLHYGYLKAISELVLSMDEQLIPIGTDLEQIHVASYYRTRLVCQFIYKNLIHLNHLLFHDDLSRIIVVSTNFSSSVQPVRAIPIEQKDDFVMSFICSIYQKLRQLGHLIESIISSTSNESNSVSILAHHESNFARSFSRAIRSSPAGQVEELWNLLDGIISQVMKKDDECRNKKICFYVDLFLILIESIRINEYNAKNIKALCDESMNNCVKSLIEVSRNDDDSRGSFFNFDNKSTTIGLYLLGWIIDLHSKCCFWLNHIPSKEEDIELTESLGIHSFVSSLLGSINILSNRDWHHENSTNNTFGALQHLSCHRIQQLHGMIHQQLQLDELSGSDQTDALDTTSSKMIEEAKLLTDFILKAAKNRHFSDSMDSSKNAGYRILAKYLATWLSYSEVNHVDSFLAWFYYTLSSEDVRNNNGYVSIDPSQVNSRLPAKIFTEEKAAALALLHDASFFELEKVNERLINVGLNCMTNLVRHAMTAGSVDSKFNILIKHIDSSQNYFAGCNVKEFLKVPNVQMSDLQDVAIDSLQKSLNILIILNGICEQSLTAHDSRILFETSLKLHSIFHHILATCASSASKLIIVKMMSGCRTSILISLPHLLAENFFLREINDSQALSSHLLKSSLDAIKVTKAEQNFNEECDKVNKLGGEILRTLIFAYSSSRQSQSNNLILLDDAENLKLLKEENDSIHILMDFYHPFIFDAVHGNKEKIFKFNLHSKNKNVTLVTLARLIGDKISKALSKNIINNEVSSMIIFFTDFVLFQSLYGCLDDIFSEQHYATLFKRLMDFCTFNREVSSSLDSIAQYFLCSMSTMTLPIRSINIEKTHIVQRVQVAVIYYHQKNYGKVPGLLDTIYCDLLSKSDEFCLSELIGYMLNEVTKTSLVDSTSLKAACLHCFHIVTLSVKGQAQKQIVSEVAKLFLDFADELQSQFPSDFDENTLKQWGSVTNEARAFTNCIIGKKDLLRLNGSDISNIISNLNVMKTKTLKSLLEIDVARSVYKMSCTILLSLFKHYYKQLYACSPSLICEVRSLFIFVMKVKYQVYSTENNKMIDDLINEVTRVSEALVIHKEVFKKHVLSLILDYVDAVQEGIESRTKSLLMPAVFNLLDCLSPHETMQMNNMVHIASKSVYQNMIRSYQNHTYKGQF